MDQTNMTKKGGRFRHGESELVIEVGPLAIYRGSSLDLDEFGGQPGVRPFYTVAIAPRWLDDSGEVNLCIDGKVRIAGTTKALDEDYDTFIHVIKGRGKYEVLVMEPEGHLSTHLELESVEDGLRGCDTEAKR